MKFSAKRVYSISLVMMLLYSCGCLADGIKPQTLDLSVSEQKEFSHLTNWSRYARTKKENGDRVSQIVFENENLLDGREISEHSRESMNRYYRENVEKYHVDSEYPCRKPRLTNFFNKKFKEDKKCKNTKINYILSNDKSTINHFDKKRVYQIHYLFAAQGEAMMSRWGHAMIRLVICDPKREQVGGDCLKDTAHHLVINYRANVPDLVLDNWKGLVGDYFSQLYYTRLEDIVREYNETELRDLYSLPLILNDNEKDLILDSFNEEFWNYAGPYKFFTRNCAIELEKILNLIYSKRKERSLDITSPLGLYESLIEKGYGDVSVIKDPQAIANGHIIKSKRKWYEDNINKINTITGENFTIPMWMKELRVEERKNLFIHFVNKFPQEETSLRRAFYNLEKQARKVFVQEVDNYVIYLATNDIQTEETDDIVKMIKSKVKENSKFSSPLMFLSENGFGIPAEDEFDKKFINNKASELSPVENYCASLENQQSKTDDPFEQKVLSRINDIDTNIKFFASVIQRKLNKLLDETTESEKQKCCQMINTLSLNYCNEN